MQSLLYLKCKVNLAKGGIKMKNRVSELRKKKKLSQEELANEVGVTRQTITSIETGKYIASLPLAFKIAKFFNLSIEEIFSMEEED